MRTPQTSRVRVTNAAPGREIDREVLEFVREQPRTMSFRQIADLAAERFGRDRAPAPAEIAADFYRSGPSASRKSLWRRDDEIVQFIAGYVGRLTHSEIREAALRTFAASRVPSRSAIGRFSQEIRARLLESPDLVLRERR